MLAGHYATALIAHQKYPKGTLLYFLIASQLQDFLWFIFHYFGLEKTGPEDVLNATLSNMSVNMLFSHDLVPQAFWLILIFIIGKMLSKSTKVALLGTLLVVGHFVLDFFSGHPHHFFGEHSQTIGLGLYATNVFLAIGIEAIFCILALMYFFKQDAANGINRTSKNKKYIIGLFVFGILFMLSIATTSFRQWFGIPEFNIGFNTNMPILISTYIGMIIYLNFFVSRYNVSKN